MVALACRKWCAFHEGHYREVIAGDPSLYLQTLGLRIMMNPSITVIYGSVLMEGGLTKILDEWGSPVAAYPNCILCWSYVPDPMPNLKAVTMTDMALSVARTGSSALGRG
ncbi:hypothetical protein [Hydrogenophaga defluvii]